MQTRRVAVAPSASVAQTASVLVSLTTNVLVLLNAVIAVNAALQSDSTQAIPRASIYDAFVSVCTLRITVVLHNAWINAVLS